MCRSILWVCLASLVEGNVAEGQVSVTASGRYVDVTAQLRRLAEYEVSEKHIPGLPLALVVDQHIVWAQGFGFADPKKAIPATAETVYRVGSISKLFTDIAIMQLVEGGQLDLDAPVNRYLPDFHPGNPFGTPVTLRELMSHRAGLVREPPVGSYFDSTQPSPADVVKSLKFVRFVDEVLGPFLRKPTYAFADRFEVLPAVIDRIKPIDDPVHFSTLLLI